MLLGLLKLDIEIREKALQRIRDLKEEYAKAEDKKHFMHRCPFLGENGCCILYDFRGLICRTFGLIHKDHQSGKVTMSFCYEYGLNYAEVYNKEIKKLDYDKVKKLGYKNIPQAYLLGLKNLMSEDIFENEKLDFGEIKSLIEWL